MRDRDWEKWDDRIPDNYYVQVNHYMMVLEAEFAVLRAYIRYRKRGDKRIAIRDYLIERKQEEIDYLKEKEREFWEHVERKNPPALILPGLKGE